MSVRIAAADRMLRGAMLLTAYRTALRAGMPAIDAIWNRDLNWKGSDHTPEAFARFMVQRTVGMWGDINRLPVLRSQVGAMMGQFRIYELNYLSTLHQLMTRMGPEGRVSAALMMGSVGMLGGTMALPFAQNGLQALQAVWGWFTGITPDLEADLRHAVDWMQPGAGDIVMHGASRDALGIDLGTIGFGDLLTRYMQSPADMAGAAVSAPIGALVRANERFQSGQGTGAILRELMPAAVKHLISALYPETGLASAATGTRVMSASSLSGADRVRLGLGFEPTAVARQYERVGESLNAIDSYRAALTKAENRMANRIAAGDDAADAAAELADVLQRGTEAGVFSETTAAEARRLIAQRVRERIAPEAGSRTMQRIQAAQQPP